MKLYAKSFEHPEHGTMYAVIGIEVNPQTVKELCPECMEENPEAFEKLKNIRDRTIELREQLKEEINETILDFTSKLSKLHQYENDYNKDFFKVESLSLGLVNSSLDQVLRKVMRVQCGGLASSIMSGMTHAVSLGILEYIDPAATKKEDLQDAENHSDLDPERKVDNEGISMKNNVK